MFRNPHRFVVGLLLSLSVLSGSLWADSAPKKEARVEPPFAVPPRQGDIIGLYMGPKGTKQVVVMIQDLHANVGVQKNIAATLYRLLRMNKTPWLLVCVEGASGEGDVSLLRSLPRIIRHAFEAMLLRKAYLTGAELAATEAAADWSQQQFVLWNRFTSLFKARREIGPVSISPIRLWGVDDPDLYRKNWRAAKIVDRQRYGALEEMKHIRAVIGPNAAPALKKHLDLLVKLFLLKLQPKDYVEFLKNRSLNPKGSAVYQSTLQAAETYYEAAEQRSVAMAKNLVDKMGGSPGYTVLITGGFHTQQIADDLKRRGISYVIVTPHVTVLDQDEAYRSRLREEE